jgi:hypothetical protein
MKALSAFYQSITGVALPSGDVAQLYKGSLTRVPRISGSQGSTFQRELERLHVSGQWHPKVMLLPDVGKFEIELLPFNPALLANGIIARYPSNVTLYSNRNARMNRFLAYQQYRLYVLRGDPRKFWTIAQRLVKASNCYLAVAMYGIDRNLYRFFKQDKLIRLIRRLNLLRGNAPLNIQSIAGFKTVRELQGALMPAVLQRRYIEFFRIYIPKPSGGERPLGVPTLAWRVYLRMWLMPMMGYTGSRLPNNFHGFIPNRGTGTAWKAILNEVIGHTNIYEIDFKSFFPSVKTDMLGYFMNSVWHLPPQTAYFFYQMNNSLPNFDDPLNIIPTEVKWSASHQDVFASDMAIRNMYRTWADKIVKIRLLDKSYDAVTQFNVPNLGLLNNKTVVGETKRKGLSPLSISAGSDDIAAIIESQTVTPSSNPLEASFRREYDITFRGNVGLPQGSPLSPYLSILYLNEVLHLSGMPSDVKFLFYADDGLFYSNNYDSLNDWLTGAFFSGSASPKSFGYYNISLSIDKSGWVRKEGEWLKPLKFLGLVYTAKTSTSFASLIAKTRSGKSNLEFNKSELMSWSHSSSLIGSVRASTIKGRLALFKGFKSTPITRAMIFYYESLLTIHNLGLPFANLENLYL